MYGIFTMEYEYKCPALVDNAALRKHRIVNKSLSSTHEMPHCEFLVRKTLEATQTTWTFHC